MAETDNPYREPSEIIPAPKPKSLRDEFQDSIRDVAAIMHDKGVKKVTIELCAEHPGLTYPPGKQYLSYCVTAEPRTFEVALPVKE
jgi:hypothetical protein